VEVQLYNKSHVPRPVGFATQGGANSVRKAVRFWMGAADTNEGLNRYIDAKMSIAMARGIRALGI
jgi:hypothetical protein